MTVPSPLASHVCHQSYYNHCEVELLTLSLKVDINIRQKLDGWITVEAMIIW